MAAHPMHPRLHRRNLVILVIFLVVLYLLLPQLGRFKSSLQALEAANVSWIGLAVVALGGMYAAAAGIYVILARQRLRYGRTLVVQMASLFASRLLPAGIGPISINYAYLRKQRHSQGVAGSVVAVNNLLGFVGNMVLLGAVLLLDHSSKIHPSWTVSQQVLALVAGIVVLVLLLCFSSRKLRRKGAVLLKSGIGNLRLYRTHPLRLLAALGCAMALTGCNAWCLYACSHAVGVGLTAVQALLALTVMVAGATITPTPGGLGGAEASLTAVFVAFGFTGAAALAAALLFRLLTYWLALIVGAAAFVAAERLRYI